ncbi:MAG: hypothetical protein GY941_25110 [Planctomycetes bacterium]|nr:hypothetical protein [Planctomycetota bacterium]
MIKLNEFLNKGICKLLGQGIKPFSHCYRKIGTLCLFLLFIFITSASHVEAISSKTPQDVYFVLQRVKAEVVLLRERARLEEPWPEIEITTKHYPRHVFQKCYETMEKVNRLRWLKKMGTITIPFYPLREITPNEVYDVSVRLLGELRIITANVDSSLHITCVSGNEEITYNTNYKALSEISMAMDSMLGLSGYTMSGIHAMSERVVSNARFIRASQNLPRNEAVPDFDMTTLRHPNHVLREACVLLEKIREVEINLWMSPCDVPNVPRRSIEPNEVYETVLYLFGELQSIKYRLGIYTHRELIFGISGQEFA